MFETLTGKTTSDALLLLAKQSSHLGLVLVMNATLHNLVRERLCPGGTWRLTDVMKSTLRVALSRLPEKKVTDTEMRYPTTRAGMRAFLDVFFARHYFQTQHSLLHYMTSIEFLELLASGRLQILDVGCGPAVVSLAITDMLAWILKYLNHLGSRPRSRLLKVTYVLNDTSGICLGTGQRMLLDYFSIAREHSREIVHSRTISIGRPFPNNVNQLQRVKSNFGAYDIAAFSYVLSPLKEDMGVDNLVGGLLNVESLCNHNGRILIVQDRFQAALVRRISKAIGVSSHKEELNQEVYPSRNANETYTYSYYSCLYAPTTAVPLRQSIVAQMSPDDAVALV